MADYFSLVKEANAEGWRVLNTFQFATHWRVNLQKHAPNGSSKEVFSEFADGKTAHEAMEAALANARNMDKHQAGRARPTPPSVRTTETQLTAQQESRLERAFGRLFLAVKTSGRT